VINFELPHVPEDYIHRIGRTGRAGKEGEAISLVCIDEAKLLHDIEHLLKIKIRKVVVPGYEPDPNVSPQPIQKGGSNTAGKQRRYDHDSRQRQVSEYKRPRQSGTKKQDTRKRSGFRPRKSSR
jgi:ATP-dependent RNA helicase RhlE